MIPLVDIILDPIEETEYYDKTYKVLLDENCILGYTYDIEAVKQAIYFILGTERYKHPIYSWDYGVALVDLFGKQTSYVKSEFKRRIEEALTQDDRIETCSDFEFELITKSKLHVTFTVNTIYGALRAELGVTV